MSERKKRKKRKKLCIVLALAISLIAVQTMQMAAEAAETPSVTAGNLAEFGMALDQVEDGGTIGITSVITIDSFMGQMGIENKHVQIVRMSADAGFEIVQGGNVTMCNMSFDGNSSEVTAARPMFLVSGSLTLDRASI